LQGSVFVVTTEIRLVRNRLMVDLSDEIVIHLQGSNVTELTGTAVKIGPSLQVQIEKILDLHHEVRFLATEYSFV